MRLRFVLPLVAFFALVGLLWVGLSLDPRALPSPLIGREAPQFDLPELRDPETRFASTEMLGKPALLNVWASWCVTCRQEHPMLAELRRAGVPVYGLNYKDTRSDALRFLAQFGDPYDAIGFDESGLVGIDWGVYATPETFLMDRHGMIRFKHIGMITPEIIENEILPLYRKLEAES
ncbi:DsbE family thiol:disulfide interchange protein [Thioalkalivibrio paradoxus]|uniref:Thiol:disulfide interchange protein n=1 Tax=Thioalkalivibrio paradoxus ARh 1 TaxID=713585 RepID=W0DMA4_9GAMM|nr:DsbE family thiol:disulfide interchange protein [Thioalkalivibrio paradoxus]AHE98025.1 thiol:disulfide interchange protein [Thioalkalivibrio paradoxus ARh 1]